MGYSAKTEIEGRELILVLPVGPMGMYHYAVEYLKDWGTTCGHVHGFNMDEWSDALGNTLDPSDPGAFQHAMEQTFYGPLGDRTIPPSQRHFATRDEIPRYPELIANLRSQRAKLVVIYGIGRGCHIAFWEPHFAGEFNSVDDWRAEQYRLAAKLHPMTIEQNAFTSFKSRTGLVSCRANTIGPGIFLQADWAIGGCDGVFGRGMQWQGLTLWTTLRHETTPWIPSTYMTTLPGELFFLEELAGPLEAECN